MATRNNGKTKAKPDTEIRIDHIAMITDTYSKLSTALAAVLPQEREGSNIDTIDQATADAEKIHSRADLEKVVGAVAKTVDEAAKISDTLRVQMFSTAAKAIRNNSGLVDMNDRADKERFLKAVFPKLGTGVTAYAAHLSAFLKAEQAGLLDELVRDTEKAVPAGKRKFDTIKSVLSAAIAAAKGTTATAKKPDAATITNILNPPTKPKGTTASSGTVKIDASEDEFVSGAEKLLKSRVHSPADVDRILVLLRAKLEKYLPKAQTPTTDKNELAPKA